MTAPRPPPRACTADAPQSGDLYASSPLPTSGPLSAAVEPVVDSSRYFVLKVID